MTMDKHRLLQVVTLLLYAGPLVAGLAGFGWSVVPGFVLIFVFWQVMQRPADWPAFGPRWTDPAVLSGILTRVILVVVLVCICLGIGRGIGGAAGYVSGVPLVAPLALSFLAIPLARLARDPKAGALRDDRTVAGHGTVVTAPPEDAAALRDAIRPLLDLPDATPDAVAMGAVVRLGDSPMSAALLRTLHQALAQGAAATAARRGLILWATDPATADRFAGTPVLAGAWAAARGRPALEVMFAGRGQALLAVDRALGIDFPPAADLREAAKASPDAAGSLEMLANALDHAGFTMPAAQTGA